MKESIHKFSQKVIGEGGVRGLATLFVLFLARRVGAERFGEYSTALAYAALCIVFVDLGTNSILTREIARHPEKRGSMAKSSHFLKLGAAIGSWFILWAVTYALKFDPEQRYLTLCLGIVVIGQTLTEYFSALLSGIEEMGWEAILKILNRLLAISLGFWALVRHQSLHDIVTQMAIGSLIGYAASICILKYRFTTFGIGADKSFLKSLLWSCLPLFGSVVFWILYDSQDILLLNYFHFAQRDIGLFSAAMKVIDVTRVYPVLMMGVFFPTLSKLHLSDPPGFQRKRRRVLLFMLGSLAVVSSIVYATAPWIIRLLYRTDYSDAASILRLLAPALVFMGLNHAQMQLLIAVNRERTLFLGAFTVCLINLGMAFVLVPRYGMPGTCYALIASEILYFVFLRKTLTTYA